MNEIGKKVDMNKLMFIYKLLEKEFVIAKEEYDDAIEILVADDLAADKFFDLLREAKKVGYKLFWLKAPLKIVLIAEEKKKEEMASE